MSAYIVWAAYLFIDRSLKIKPVIQRRLDFLKAGRFGRYVLNELVWWAPCEGSHSLGRIFIFKQILENRICDPASAGISEGRQIWEIPFKRTCLVGFMLRVT